MNPAMLATKTKISFHFTYAAAVYSNGGKNTGSLLQSLPLLKGEDVGSGAMTNSC